MNEPQKPKTDVGYWEAFGLVWDVLITILVTTVIFAVGGRWLDDYFKTGWIFTVIGFALLILVGYRVIKRKADKIAQRLDDTPNS